LATRFKISLAHAGCDNAGPVIWEERPRADAPGQARPAVVSLPRGFVSLNGEDGSIEIMCTGCRQTVASAASSGGTAIAELTGNAVAAGEDDAPETAIATAHAESKTTHEPAETISDETIPDDLRALFDEAEDVAPIRGDAIPRNLFDRLHHLADRLRNRGR
jgi:hypothetical protein